LVEDDVGSKGGGADEVWNGDATKSSLGWKIVPPKWLKISGDRSGKTTDLI